MKKPLEITQENAREAREKMKEKKLDAKAYRKLLVIALKGEGKDNKEIAMATNFKISYVPKLISKFYHKGIEGLLKDERGGANNRRVSEWQEKKFLSRWRARAEKGRIITAKEMRLDFQETYNVSITESSFHRLLNRHEWRKKQPRKRHIKSAGARIKRASKKLNVVQEKSESVITRMVAKERGSSLK